MGKQYFNGFSLKSKPKLLLIAFRVKCRRHQMISNRFYSSIIIKRVAIFVYIEIYFHSNIPLFFLLSLEMSNWAFCDLLVDRRNKKMKGRDNYSSEILIFGRTSGLSRFEYIRKGVVRVDKKIFRFFFLRKT